MRRLKAMPDEISRAKELLSQGLSVQAVADELGLVKKTLERRFTAEVGVAPGSWRQQTHGPRENTSRAVFFRFPEYDLLQEVAAAEGTSPNEWARNAVLRALQRASKKK